MSMRTSWRSPPIRKHSSCVDREPARRMMAPINSKNGNAHIARQSCSETAGSAETAAEFAPNFYGGLRQFRQSVCRTQDISGV